MAQITIYVSEEDKVFFDYIKDQTDKSLSKTVAKALKMYIEKEIHVHENRLN
jgi:hypothetical protein